MYKSRNSQHGFTLIEIIVSTALIGLVIGIVVSTQQLSIRTFRFGESRVQIRQELQLAAMFITDNVRTVSQRLVISDDLVNGSVQSILFFEPSQNGDYALIHLAEDSTRTALTQYVLTRDFDDWQNGSFFRVVEDPTGSKRYFLEYNLVVTDGYLIHSRVLLRNLSSYTAFTPGSHIHYR